MQVHPPRHPLSAWRPWLLALGLWLSLAAVTAAVLWRLHREAIDVQARELDLLSLALTDAIDRGLRGAEEGMRAVRDEWHEGHLPLDRGEATPALQTRAELMPMVQTLWLTAAAGHVLAASDGTPLPVDSSFVPALGTLAGDALALSRPFGHSRSGGPQLALAIALGDMPGAEVGWIIAAMPARALLGAFGGASPAADARMAVFRSDGVLLAGTQAPAPARDDPEAARRLAQRPTMELRKFNDGSEHLVSVHQVARYGLQVVVSRELGAALATWRNAAEVSAGVLLLLLASIAAAVQGVQRADRRRGEAQRALQLQISRASRLEALGTLAGGVAHDFNSVLAAIVGFGEMAQDAAPRGSHQARHLDKVMQAALRGKSLVERVLAFSRGGAHVSTVFDPEPVVQEVLTLLSASLRPGVVLERDFAAHGACVRGDPTQFFEAVMNLCTNALQAMPDGGMLSVRLTRAHVDTPQVLSHSSLARGDHVVLSVADQGVGITPEVMEHLFEPFFTTRGAHSGTGLGLAVVHGVLAEFAGAADVTSAPGQGACFRLYFPECKDAPERSPQVAGSSAPHGAGQTVLVVDDEPTLVAMTVEMLRDLGYEPVGFSNPASALQALRDEPRRFAALITDEMMPGLGGTQLIEAARAVAPELPVLMVSGHGGALLARRAVAAGAARVLTKPLQRADLARALSALLD